MKQIFTILFSISCLASYSQCEDRNSAGSISLHASTGARNGFGGELGQQGLLNRLSGFLGMDISFTHGYKGSDSTISLVYVKAVYRVYQNQNEDLYLAAVMAPAVLNVDFEFLSGLRLLYVTGRNTAVSVEPIWYLVGKKFFVNASIHFLL